MNRLKGRTLRNKISRIFSSQPVLCIATAAMLITCFFVRPDKEYLSYFNWRTIATLFCTLAVVGAYAHIHTFEILSRAIVVRLHTKRNAIIGIVLITFFGSMLLANDMALLTFLPLGYFVLKSTGNEKDMAFTFIMQNIAANLGGMVTPFGNPQNLYLYAFYGIETGEFTMIMLPPFLLSTAMILLLCFTVKNAPLELKDDTPYKMDVKRTIIYSVLFIFSLLIVFRIVDYIAGTVIVFAALLFLDKKALREVNYPLLLTFCVFFVFSGNMARIPAVYELLSGIIPKNTLLFGLLSCQFISNVPSAVLLSHFTEDYRSLLPAVNIGGLGTLIASLASLITFTTFRAYRPEESRKYFFMFSGINFGLLIILYFFERAIL